MPEPSDYIAELNRLLGLPENARFEDLEFALPEYWWTKAFNLPSANALRGLPLGFTRSKPNRRTFAFVSFAGSIHDMGETNFLAENGREALADLRDYLRNEFRRYPHQPQAELPEEPKLLDDP